MDEYGNPTRTRKISPKEWYKTYNEKEAVREKDVYEIPNLVPEISLKIPNDGIDYEFLTLFHCCVYYLINIDDIHIVELLSKHRIYQTLNCAPFIFETKELAELFLEDFRRFLLQLFEHRLVLSICSKRHQLQFL